MSGQSIYFKGKVIKFLESEKDETFIPFSRLVNDRVLFSYVFNDLYKKYLGKIEDFRNGVITISDQKMLLEEVLINADTK